MAEPITDIADFLFNTPLYAKKACRGDDSQFGSVFRTELKVDGYCVKCRKETTFERVHGRLNDLQLNQVAQGFSVWETFTLRCARDESHGVKIYFYINAHEIQKVGQYPSLADIANDETKHYRKILSKNDAAEFHKAIGLAAHGVGIGSYVYLRRIFERLIQNRYDEFKQSEGWNDADFASLRMIERIEFLKNHLPNFLVENKKIYGILSRGIHELDETQCNGFFPILKSSIVVILEEDKRNKEEAARKAELKKAIDQFGANS